MKRLIFFFGLACLAATATRADSLRPARQWTPAPIAEPVGLTCKSVGTCQEAVELWCGGYSRADGDGDDVPVKASVPAGKK